MIKSTPAGLESGDSFLTVLGAGVACAGPFGAGSRRGCAVNGQVCFRVARFKVPSELGACWA